jgi:hypothetical protein
VRSYRVFQEPEIVSSPPKIPVVGNPVNNSRPAGVHPEALPGLAFFVRNIAVLGYYSFKPLALGDAISSKAVLR